MKNQVFSLIILLVLLPCFFTWAGGQQDVIEDVQTEFTAEELLPETLTGKMEFLHFVPQELYLPLLDAFQEKYPEVEIEILSKGIEANNINFMNNFNSSKPADVAQFWAQLPAKEAYEQGVLAPIDGILDAMDFFEKANGAGLALARIMEDEGNPSLIVPLKSALWGMWYNKHVWKDSGLTENDIPETWAEFLDVCKKIQDAGYTPLLKNGDGIGWSTMAYVEYFINRTSPDYKMTLQNLEDNFDDERFRKADQYWDDIIPFFSPNADTMKYNNAWMGFANGEGAMFFCGSWVLNNWDKDMELVPGVDYGVFRFPTIDPNVEPTESLVQDQGIVLSTKGASNPVARAFIAFVASEEGQKIFNEKGAGAVPVLKGMESTFPMNDVLGELLEGSKFNPMWQFKTELREDMFSIWNGRSLGMFTTEEIVPRLDEIYEDYLKMNSN